MRVDVPLLNSRDNGFEPETAMNWLKGHGYDAEAIYERMEPGAAKRACLEIWLKEAGKRVTKTATIEKLEEMAQDVYRETSVPP